MADRSVSLDLYDATAVIYQDELTPVGVSETL